MAAYLFRKNSVHMSSQIDLLSTDIPYVRPLEKTMGLALARRTVFRAEDKEDWGRVATRVALGNSLLHPSGEQDFKQLRNLIAKGAALLSGRHLQHGDENQPKKNLELHSNCSTSATSFILFYLLLNGSGVGRAYDDAMMVTDWDNAPKLVNLLSKAHPDFADAGDSVIAAEEFNPDEEETYFLFRVPDSREGWAMAFEQLETMTFQKIYTNTTLVLDWSAVRAKGSPIGGMQERPASGPVPTIKAFISALEVKGRGYPKWKQAMFVDHFLAECVLVGGARRAARMATKDWNDEGIFEFIKLKKDYPFLYSSNNSVIADEEFWNENNPRAKAVLETVAHSAYHHGTGEPGIINVHRFAQQAFPKERYELGDFVASSKYQLSLAGRDYYRAVSQAFNQLNYQLITNPCGEISLNLLGGYCVIADGVPFYTDNDDEAESMFRHLVRFLIRVNLMESLYGKETKETNRIGVSFTGLHEYAWDKYGLTFRDMLDEHGRAKYFWKAISRFSRAVKDEAKVYSNKLGVNVPLTDTTVKPAGSTSKLYGLSEGAHLPSMREYLRWMQFRSDASLVQDYAAQGYPTKELKTYQGTTVVGFPTQPTICKLGIPVDQLVTAAEATPEEQYQYLMLLEKYWITGVNERGEMLADTGNQVSYTLKYDPKIVSFEEFLAMLKKYQSQIKCCSVMPQTDATAYEYQPEQPVSIEEFTSIVEGLSDPEAAGEFDLEQLKCASGACPI